MKKGATRGVLLSCGPWVCVYALATGVLTACVEESPRANITAIRGELHAPSLGETSGVLVRLTLVRDDGVETDAQLSAFTDARGDFVLDPLTELGPGFLVRADMPQRTLRAPAIQDGEVVLVHPALEGLVQMVADVTAAGRSWAELDQAALRELHDLVLDELPEDLETRDGQWYLDWARQRAGDRLAELLDGRIEAWPSARVLGPNEEQEGPDLSELDAPPPYSACIYPHYLMHAEHFNFDLLPDGSLCDGNDGNQFDAFDVAFRLRVIGEQFVSGGDAFPAQSATRLEDAEEIVLGPAMLENGLEVVRKVLVPHDRDLARYLEIVSNPTQQDMSVTLQVQGDLGSDENTLLLVSESGNGHVEIGDHYAATVEVGAPDPTVGFVWDGDGADAADRLYLPPDSFGGFQITWEEVTVPAGKKAVLAHFVLLSTVREPEAVAARLRALHGEPVLSGLSADEAGALRNWDTTSIANVRGAPGSSAPMQMLSIRSQRTGNEVGTVAAADGSFAVLMLDVLAGEQLAVRSVGGTEQTVHVEQ